MFYGNVVLKTAHEVIDTALSTDLQDAIKETRFGFFLFKQREDIAAITPLLDDLLAPAAVNLP